jgi:WD40 repeat protein
VGGDVLVVGDERGQVRAWSISTRRPLGPAMAAHGGPVASVSVSPDGRRAVSAGAGDGMLQAWSIGPSGLDPLQSAAVGATPQTTAIVPNRQLLIVGTLDGLVQVRDAGTLTLRQDIGSSGSIRVHSAGVAQVIPLDSGDVVTVGMDGWVNGLSLSAFGTYGSQRMPAPSPIVAAVDPASAVALVGSVDGTVAAIGGVARTTFGLEVLAHSATVKFGETTRPDRVPVIEYGPVDPATGQQGAEVSVRAVNRRGRWGEEVVARTPFLARVTSAVALGGARVAVVDAAGVVQLYDGARRTATYEAGTVGNLAPAVVPLGRQRIAVVTGSEITVLDTTEGSLRETRVIAPPKEAGSFYGAASFPGGRRLVASLTDRSLRVFDTRSGQQLRDATVGVVSPFLAIAPGGRFIAQYDPLTGVISIRDGRTLRQSGRDLVSPGFPLDLTWMHDGARLAAVSTDGALHYWDIAERRELAQLQHGSKVEGVFALRDSSFVYTAGLGRVREWDLSPRHATRAACEEAGRNFTRAEWSTYLDGDYRTTCPRASAES